MAYILTTLVFWVFFGLLVPFRQWRAYYPTLIFSALLGTVSDLMGVVFKQWVYIGPTVGGLSLWSDLGIAPAEGGLFIRLFPSLSPWWGRLGYLTVWAVLNAWFEYFFVRVGWIGYDEWRPIKAFLFYLFYFGMVWLQEYWYQGTSRVRPNNFRK